MTFSIIEVIIGAVALLAGFIAYRAHQDHLSFKAEATKDLAAVEATAKADLAALESRVRSLEAKVISVVTPAPAPSTAPAAQPLVP